MSIDINSDMGELNHLLADGTYEKLMDHVTSINVACGGHAGDDEMMAAMVLMAKIRVLVLAHTQVFLIRKTSEEKRWKILTLMI